MKAWIARDNSGRGNVYVFSFHPLKRNQMHTGIEWTTDVLSNYFMLCPTKPDAFPALKPGEGPVEVEVTMEKK